MTIIVRVKDRGRDLAVHKLETPDEARELNCVYQQLGYAAEKILVEQVDDREERAA